MSKKDDIREMQENKRERAAQARCILATMDERDVDILCAALMDAVIDKETDIQFELAQSFSRYNLMLDGVMTEMRR